MGLVAIVSPAKTLDWESKMPRDASDKPVFIKKAEEINAELKKLSALKLKNLQSISDKLAELNYNRNQHWSVKAHKNEARPAIFAFKGDVYQGLDAYSLSKKALDFAPESMLILSGLYGILRPYDAILPYRLEMGTKLKNKAGSNLYAVWKPELADWINKNFAKKTLINLASNEYAEAIDLKKLKVEVVDVVFKDFSKGTYKVIAFYAKKARGMMLRYILEKQIKDVKSLQKFNMEGYRYDKNASSAKELVFLRVNKENT